MDSNFILRRSETTVPSCDKLQQNSQVFLFIRLHNLPKPLRKKTTKEFIKMSYFVFTHITYM